MSKSGPGNSAKCRQVLDSSAKIEQKIESDLLEHLANPIERREKGKVDTNNTEEKCEKFDGCKIVLNQFFPFALLSREFLNRSKIR